MHADTMGKETGVDLSLGLATAPVLFALEELRDNQHNQHTRHSTGSGEHKQRTQQAGERANTKHSDDVNGESTNEEGGARSLFLELRDMIERRFKQVCVHLLDV